MADTRPALPDHLAIDPRSPHHVREVFEHDIGILFNGNEIGVRFQFTRSPYSRVTKAM